MDLSNLEWTRMPGDYEITDDKVRITTLPHTDLWQRTYYHFRNDNAPVLQSSQTLHLQSASGWRMTASSLIWTEQQPDWNYNSSSRI